MRKIASAAIATLMAVSALSAVPAAAEEPVSFTIFNSKTELQEYFEEAAAKYSEENNVDIEVYYSNDTVAAHLSTRYASGAPYTLNMTDAKDIHILAKEYGYDLSDQDWVKDTDYAVSVDGKVMGFPFCVEARGILFNADAIENMTGEAFDPAQITSLDDFDAFCQQLVDAGMEHPTVILKPDWSLAAHYLQQVYEEREDVQGFIDSLYDGTADLVSDEKFNALMDTFDVLRKYNAFSDAPLTAEDEIVHLMTSEGEAAFQFGGCWEWNDIIDYDYTGRIGMMPVPQNTTDLATGCLVGGGSKFFYVDNSQYTTDEQRATACDFLNWLVYSDEGQFFVSDTCACVSPFSNNEVPCTNDLGAYVKQFADAGKLIPNYDYDPDDHYAVLGAEMQKYLNNSIDRETFAKIIEDYWASAKVILHG